MKNFFKNFISVDEARFSVLAFLLIISVITALLLLVLGHGFDNNLLTLCGYLVSGITAINGFALASTAYSNKQQLPELPKVQDQESANDNNENDNNANNNVPTI